MNLIFRAWVLKRETSCSFRYAWAWQKVMQRFRSGKMTGRELRRADHLLHEFYPDDYRLVRDCLERLAVQRDSLGQR